MIILALDLGTKCGWKIGDRQMSLSGVWDLSGTRFSGGGMRFVTFHKMLVEATAQLQPDLVLYEEVHRHIGNAAGHIYGAFWGQLTAWCEREGFPYQGVPVQTIKKFATGKGNAKKDAVIAAMQLLGLHPRDDNEADAMALWEYGQHEFGGK